MLIFPAWASPIISRWIFSGRIGSAICKCTPLSDDAAGLNGKPQQHFCWSDSRPCTMTMCPGHVRDHSAESGDSTWSPMEKAAAPGSLPHILGCFLPSCLTYLLCQLEPWRSCCWFNPSTNSPMQIQMKSSPSQGGLVPGVSDSNPNSCMESWNGHFIILPTGLSHRCPSTHALLNSEPEVPTALSHLFLLMTKMDLLWYTLFMEVSFDICCYVVKLGHSCNYQKFCNAFNRGIYPPFLSWLSWILSPAFSGVGAAPHIVRGHSGYWI